MDPESRCRDALLERLRRSIARHPPFAGPFESKDPPALRDVTRAEGDRHALARLFVEKLEAVSGAGNIVGSAGEAIELAQHLVRNWSDRSRQVARALPAEPLAVLSWAPEHLGLPGLEDRFAALGMELLVPDQLDEDRMRNQAATTAVGLTGVDAAFASTGSLLLLPGPGKSRAASLLPLYHLVLIPLSKLHPTFEVWLRSARAKGDLGSLIRDAGQAVFITGPSKSADIELNLTLGVHGPLGVHALLFDDCG